MSELEEIGVVHSIDGIRAKHAAKKQYFGRQKKPHAKLACLELLLACVEVMSLKPVVLVLSGVGSVGGHGVSEANKVSVRIVV